MQGYTESHEEQFAQQGCKADEARRELSEQFAERERAISEARAELRAEREQLTPDRAEADKLLAEARAARQEAVRARSRSRRLAARFAARLEQRNEATRQQLARRAEELDAESARLASEVARFNEFRGDFYTAAAATRDRFREAWVAIEAQQKRAAEEWEEAGRYFTEQTAALDARAADMARREKATGDRLAQAEAEAAGLQAEATALEQRVLNARASLAELEQRRDRIRAELLECELPVELTPSSSPGDLSQREQVLKREKAAVTVLRSYLEREAADLDDRRRLVAEQLSQLADARVRWQRAERQTVLEMEELARALRRREQELDGREQRLIRADARRRTEAYNLWQQQLQLQAWQSRIAAGEMRRHSELEKLEADFARRLKHVTRREALLGVTLARWEQVRISNYAQLTAEREHWAADRERMKREAEAFERSRQEMLRELTTHAARALAAEQLVAEAMQDSGADRARRRLRVMRKRLERTFARKAEAIDARAAELAAERLDLEQRHRELHDRLAELVERETEANARQMEAEREALLNASMGAADAAAPEPATPSPELASLREELERLAASVLDLEPPEIPDSPPAELPWALEEAEASRPVLQFESGSRAA